MMTWQYHNGEWSEIDNPFPLPNDADWEKEIQGIGFHKWHVLGGEEYYPSIEIWWHLGDKPNPTGREFLAWYSLSGDGAKEIWIPNLPSLLQFIRENAPVIQAQVQLEFEKLRQSGLEKAFQIWHEHSLEEICLQCDPFTYEMRERQRRERQQKKAQASARKG